MNLKQLISLVLVSTFLQVSFAQKTRQAAWQQTVNYKIEVRLDDKNHMLRGFETFTYINNSPDEINEIYIHLWPNAYKNDQTAFAKQMLENGESSFYFSKEEERGYIDSLDFFINGNPNIWSFDPKHIDIAQIPLTNPLKPHDSVVVSTPFLVKIPKVFSRLGHEGQTYNMTQWYPKPAVYDVNGWNPIPYLNQGEFYSEFGSFDVKITLPKNYIIAATGHLNNKEEIDFRNAKGKKTEEMENTFCTTPEKTIHFTQNNIHDFAWFASKKFGLTSSYVKIGDKTIETFVFSENEKELIYKNLDAIRTALIYYSENAGRYPYEHATVVKSSMKAGGGMEYPMITVCDILSKEVIIHEVGHNWFYGILGSNERRYPWMDESINSYFESQAMNLGVNTASATEKQNGFLDNINDLSMQLLAINEVRNNTDQAVGLHSKDYAAINYGTMVYGKGALIFKHLCAYLGDETFKKCFNTYFNTWQYRHPLPDDMKAVFEEVSGKNLDWFFNGVINGDEVPDFKFKSVSKDASGNKILSVKKGNFLSWPVPVGVMNGSDKETTVWVEPGSNTVSVPATYNKATLFMIDPDDVVFESNRKNNGFRTKGIFKKYNNPGFKIGMRPDNKLARDMYYMPLIGYNIHNGFLAGLAFHNWSLPERKFSYIIAPMWGFKTSTLTGYANVNYKMTFKKVFQSVDMGVKNAAFGYSPIGIEPYNFFRTNGYLNFCLNPKSLRSTKSNNILLEYTNVAARWMKKLSNTEDSILGKTYYAINTAPIDYNYARLTFKHQNKRLINPYSINLSIENGGYKGGDRYWKPGLEINYTQTYKKEKKGFSIRAFAGTFIGSTGGNFGLFKYRLGSKNGQYDYGMEEPLMGRGATSGLWSHNIVGGGDKMKLNGTLGNFTKAFATVSLTSTLPGKIPFQPYVDLCYMQDDILLNSSNKYEHFIYSGGISLVLIPQIFEVHFPLVQSQVISDVQKLSSNINTFGKRICFTLVISEFEPHKLFKRIKLF
jgi:hypothetical protein